MNKRSPFYKQLQKKFLAEILIYFFLVTITASVYWQVQHHDFVIFDDNEYITENPRIHDGLNTDSIIWAFTSFHSNNWHPLTWISHMLDVKYFGMNAGRHHLMNLFFHVANTLLIFLIFRKMTGSLWESAFVAALFAIHPMHVESVAWASERKDVLSTFFWMLTILSYIWYIQNITIKRYLPVFLFCLCGLLSKPMVVTLPFVLLLLDYWPLNRIQFNIAENNSQKIIFKNLIFEKIPLIALATVSSLITFFAQKAGGVVKSFDAFSITSRVSNAIISYVKYIFKMFYPIDLAFLYPHPGTYPIWEITGASLLLIIATILALKYTKKYPYVIVGWLWYIGTMVPVIGLVQVGRQSMADRYTYVPFIGLFIILSWGASDLFKKLKYRQIGIAVTAMSSLLFLSIITWNQIEKWKTSAAMLQHAIKVTSDNYIAHDLLGVDLYRKGQIDESIKEFKKAIQIKPEYKFSHFNMGVALFKKGKIETAIKEFEKAIIIQPAYFDAHINLGIALFQKGQINKAIDHYLQASKIKPDHMITHLNLGIILAQQGRTDEAIKHLLHAIRINPGFAEAYYRLGNILSRENRIESAKKYYLKALAINPEFINAKKNLEKISVMKK